MPYTGPGDASLPDYIQDLPEDDRSQWVAVWNSAYDDCIADGGQADECESSAFAQANSVVLNRGGTMSKIHEIWEKVRAAFEPALTRTIKDVDAWSGAAANYADTDAYCAACLINVNAAADRDEKAQSHCMLPVRGPDDSADTYVRQAVYAAAGGHGLSQVKKPDDVPQDAWDEAVEAAANKLISAYGEMDEVAPDGIYELAGKEPPEERALALNRLYAQVDKALYDSDDWPWLLDLYYDDGETYALAAAGGLLYRYPLTIAGEVVTLGERMQVTEIHEPVGRAMQVHRQADGRWRFTVIAATAVLNRQGEIDSRELFGNFVRRAEESGDYPLYQFYHLGDQFRLGQVDYTATDDAVYIATGLLDDEDANPLARAARVAMQEEPEHWGNSIGFQSIGEADMVEIAEDIKVPVYRDGINGEISMLPESDAAAWFTALCVNEEVKRHMNQKTQEALERLLADDPDALAKFIGLVDDTNERAQGLVTRDVDTDTGPEADPDPQPDVERTIELDEEAMAALVETLAESEQLRALLTPITEQLTTLETARQALGKQLTDRERAAKEVVERLTALERDDDDKRQQWQADLPARSTLRVSYRPREEHAQDDGGEPDLASRAEATLAGMN